MGNVECCRQKQNFEHYEYKEEGFILEVFEYFSKKMVNNANLQEMIKKYFSIDLLDIEGEPLDWITKQNYHDFISIIFNQTSEKALQYIILEYNKIKYITIKDYTDNNFHLLLAIWLIGISPPNTLSQEDKIEMIKNIILKCSKYITYLTFSKFLNAYLEMMLIELTFNFNLHNFEDTTYLLKKIYTSSHVKEYSKWLCWKMTKIITKNKKNILSDNIAINNEFIKDEDLNFFFQKYSFLLNLIELRKNFFNKYINNC